MLGLAFEIKVCLVQAALFRDMFSNKGSPLAVHFIPVGILLVKKLFHKNSFYSCDDIFIPFEPERSFTFTLVILKYFAELLYILNTEMRKLRNSYLFFNTMRAPSIMSFSDHR